MPKIMTCINQEVLFFEHLFFARCPVHSFSRALSPPIIGLNALHIIYLTNIGLLFVRIFFLLQPLGCKICRPLKNVSVLVLCRSFSHVSLCVSVLVFLFFILLLCILFFLLSFLGYWVFGAQFCDTWVAFDVMCSTASILNLCAISLDRYIHIKDPLR